MPPFYRNLFLLAKPSVHHHLLSRWFNQSELIVHQVMRQQPDTGAGRAVAEVHPLFAVDERGPRDVQVCPGRAFGELAQELRRGDRSSRPFGEPCVADVRDPGLDGIFKLRIDRQAPEAVVGHLRGLGQFLSKFVITGHKARVIVPQGDDARAGQGRDKIGRASCRERG